MQLTEVTGRASAQTGEVEELKRSLERMRDEQHKLSSENTELEGLRQTMET